MMFTGLGPRDALTLPRSFYKANEIATNRSKTGEPVFWPCPVPLIGIIAEAPKHDAITLCANSEGKPWTVSGFRASWRRVRIQLEREGKIGPALTLYGLRHTGAGIFPGDGLGERPPPEALGPKKIKKGPPQAQRARPKPQKSGGVKLFEEKKKKRKKK